MEAVPTNSANAVGAQGGYGADATAAGPVAVRADLIPPTGLVYTITYDQCA